MPTLRTRLELLSVLPPAAASQMLLRAVDLSLAGERRLLWQRLVETREPEALAWLIAHVHELSDDVLDALAASPAARLVPALTDAVRAPSTIVRRNAVRIIGRRRDPLVGELLGSVLADADEDTVDAAAEVLLGLALEACGSEGRRRPTAAARGALERAVTGIAGRRPGGPPTSVLVAAGLLALDPGPDLRGWMEAPDGSATLELQRVTGCTDHPIVCGLLLAWLGTGPLGASAARRLSELRTPEQLEAMLGRSALLRVPERRGAVRRADRPARCVPAPPVLGSIDEAHHAGLVDYLAALGLSASRRRGTIAGAARRLGPSGRLRAIATLPALDPSGAWESLLEPATADDEPRLRRAAGLACLASLDRLALERARPGVARAARQRAVEPTGAGPAGQRAGPAEQRAEPAEPIAADAPAEEATAERPGRRAAARARADLGAAAIAALEGLASDAAPSVAALARARLARRSIDRLGRSWSALPPRERMLAARILAHDEPEALAERLGRLVDSADRGEALAALQIARRLGFVHQLMGRLTSQAAGEDPIRSAAAISALGEDAPISAAPPLVAALGRADHRVRATAVESLTRLVLRHRGHAGIDPIEDRLFEALPELVESRDNRVRANAIWSLDRLAPERSADALRAMLMDPSPLHRISGTWVARRIRSRAVLPTLEWMARHDRSPMVRQRAEAARRIVLRAAPLRLAEPAADGPLAVIDGPPAPPADSPADR